MIVGFTVFFLLSAVALAASVAIASRLEGSGRAETALATMMLWAAHVTLPALLLGWVNLLYRGALGATVAVVAIATGSLALTFGRRTFRENLSRMIANAHDFALLPFNALLICWRAGSIAFLGVAAVLAVIVYTLWLSWLAPSGSWDGVWYHESIVGFALQNHGFSWVRIPTSLEYVNGFPKVCEMMNLWFVAFADRRLIEGPSSIMLAALMLATYVVVRRYVDNAASALGWASAIALMPGAVLELRSTYIDVPVTAFLLAALHFATRPVLRFRDAWPSALMRGMVLGSKGHALVYTPLVGVVLVVRLMRMQELTRFRGLLSSVGVTATVLLIGGPTYVRNWIVHRNPVWPVDVQRKWLHLKFIGVGEGDISDQNKPWTDVIDSIFTLPKFGSDLPDTRDWGYGIGLPWTVLPIAIVGLAAAVVMVAWRRWHDRAPDRVAENLLITAIPMLIALKLSPAIWWSRFNIHAAAALVAIAAWATSGRWRALGDAAIGACVVTSCLLMYWAEPGWGLSWKQATVLAKETPAERATFQIETWTPQPNVVRLRDLELGDGDVVTFSDDRFTSFLWNERMSNRIEYVPFTSDGKAYLASLDAAHAKWAAIQPGDGFDFLKKSPAWLEVGVIARNEPHWIAFRRRR